MGTGRPALSSEAVVSISDHRLRGSILFSIPRTRKDVRLRSRRKSAMTQKGRPRPLPPLCAYAQWRKKRKYTPLSVPAEHAQWRGGVAARTLLLGLVSRVPPISNSSYLTGSEAVQPTKTRFRLVTAEDTEKRDEKGQTLVYARMVNGHCGVGAGETFRI